MTRAHVASYLERLALSSALADPGCMALLGGDRLDARSVVLCALDGIAEHIEAKDAAAEGWQRIAVLLVQAGGAKYNLLSTADREALERAVAAERERLLDAADLALDRTKDAASYWDQGPEQSTQENP